MRSLDNTSLPNLSNLASQVLGSETQDFQHNPDSAAALFMSPPSPVISKRSCRNLLSAGRRQEGAVPVIDSRLESFSSLILPLFFSEDLESLVPSPHCQRTLCGYRQWSVWEMASLAPALPCVKRPRKPRGVKAPGNKGRRGVLTFMYMLTSRYIKTSLCMPKFRPTAKAWDDI